MRDTANDYMSICDKCGRRTWYDVEQQCHCTYPPVKTCKTCGHSETLDGEPVRCTGTLRLIDNSNLDPRLTPYYKSGARVEITWRAGYEDYTGYGARCEGKRARGTIGKSTGWKPVYLLILTARSMGGGAIMSEAIESIRAI